MFMHTNLRTFFLTSSGLLTEVIMVQVSSLATSPNSCHCPEFSVTLLLLRTLHWLQLHLVTCLSAEVQHVNALIYMVIYRQWTLANPCGAAVVMYV